MVSPGERSLWKALGPGLLFAGAAVGVSHIVQSTRAGAVYGLGLLGLIVLANLIKYVPFAFGPWYAAATGTSLLEGYRRRGRWALVVYGALTLGTMFTVQAGVTVVTAALAIVTLGIPLDPISVSAILLALCTAVLVVGRFALLDAIIKLVVVALTLTTFAATALVIGRLDWSTFRILPDAAMLTGPSVLFLAALVGWMPSAIDVAVWHSLWTLARRRQTRHAPSMRDAMIDFNVGYLGTALLALCFVFMGAGVMHGSGESFQDSAAGFVSQVIGLYTATLGEWTGPLVGGCALAVMFSTTLTVIDGFPRALDTLVARFRAPEAPDDDGVDQMGRGYWIWLAVLGLGSIGVLWKMLSTLTGLIDLATTLSFLTAPILSWLNHRAVLGDEVPPERRPGPKLRWASLASIAVQVALAGYYMFIRFGS